MQILTVQNMSTTASSHFNVCSLLRYRGISYRDCLTWPRCPTVCSNTFHLFTCGQCTSWASRVADVSPLGTPDYVMPAFLCSCVCPFLHCLGASWNWTRTQQHSVLVIACYRFGFHHYLNIYLPKNVYVLHATMDTALPIYIFTYLKELDI
jgi:hypothetical protein